MLIENLYQVEKLDDLGANNYEAHIRFNKEHEVFKGHFPGNPIVPGVCMMQIVKELTASVVKKKLLLKSSNNIKFMALINPFETPLLRINLCLEEKENAEISVKNTCFFEDTLAVKMNVNYQLA